MNGLSTPGFTHASSPVTHYMDIRNLRFISCCPDVDCWCGGPMDDEFARKLREAKREPKPAWLAR